MKSLLILKTIEKELKVSHRTISPSWINPLWISSVNECALCHIRTRVKDLATEHTINNIL